MPGWWSGSPEARVAARVLRAADDARPPLATRFLRFAAAAVFVVLLGSVGGVLSGRLDLLADVDKEGELRVIGGVVTAAAFVIGLAQWFAARHESSFDKYYDRLNVANNRFDQAIASRMKSPPDPIEMQEHHYTMFTFSEIDNLEYIIEKHCMGYVNRPLVGRAFLHFLQRCKDEEFRNSVAIWIDKGGYSPRTLRVARRLIGDAEEAARP